MIRTLVVEDDPVLAEAHRLYVARVPGFEVADHPLDPGLAGRGGVRLAAERAYVRSGREQPWQKRAAQRAGRSGDQDHDRFLSFVVQEGTGRAAGT